MLTQTHLEIEKTRTSILFPNACIPVSENRLPIMDDYLSILLAKGRITPDEKELEFAKCKYLIDFFENIPEYDESQDCIWEKEDRE